LFHLVVAYVGLSIGCKLSLYLSVVLFILDKLRKGEKRQIQIPMDTGRNMLGVMDETGVLEYGEVYVQYTCKDTDKLIVHKGT